jgi:hypothetical protein
MQDPIKKIMKAKRARGVSQVVDHPRLQLGALFSPPIPQKKKKKKNLCDLRPDNCRFTAQTYSILNNFTNLVAVLSFNLPKHFFSN